MRRSPQGYRNRRSEGGICSAAFALVAAITVIAFSGGDAPLALAGDGFATVSRWLGGGVFVPLLVGLYRWIARAGRAAVAT